MSNDMKKVFGIDLGTTYSCISHVDENGKAVITTNAEGELITPSVVFFDDGGDNIIVGNAAKESAKIYPNDVAAFVKRSIADEHFLFMHEGNEYSVEEISSYIIRKLIKDAEDKVGEKVEQVVITCPAYFGINEREATRKAGEIAGVEVLEIINEPTAAAVAYGLTEENTDKTILVYDLGGGTFDITMIQISENKIEVVVTGGDHTLGGKDWDDAIINYLVEQYHEQTGNDDDILLDPETFQDLLSAAESAKKTLTQLGKAPISFIHGTDRINVELTKDKFEELTAHLVERTISLTNLMLDEAKKKGVESFDDILLVGGSTRMPQISEAITVEFNKTPIMYEPDEAVAKGAALYGHKISIQNEVIDIYNALADDGEKMALGGSTDEADQQLLDEATGKVAEKFKLSLGSVESSVKQEIINVTSKSFGIIAFNQDNEEIVANLIVKNNTVPTEITQGFTTREDFQENVDIVIMESEVSDATLAPEDAQEIGLAELTLPAGLPKGSPIEVTFTLNEEGRLDIKAVETSEGGEVTANIETESVISGEKLEAAKERSRAITVI